MQKLTDVVYALGTGSVWKNNEIRFSLRSIEKNGINVGKIFVVGVRPDFLTDKVIHIPAEDIYNPTVNADGNITHKVLAACSDKRLSQDFLFINDDHILLKPIDLKQVPAFHKGDMNTFSDNYWTLNYWRSRLKRTRDTLNERELTALHFDCHVPTIFNKVLFPEVMSGFDFREGIGLTMKSLYGNSVYSASCNLLEGEKKTIFEFLSLEQITDRLADCGFMSFNASGLNNSLKIWLYRQFPNRSKYENYELEDRTLDILKWSEGDRDFAVGVNLFEKYMHGKNLVSMFQKGGSEALRKKLEYKLINAISSI